MFSYVAKHMMCAVLFMKPMSFYKSDCALKIPHGQKHKGYYAEEHDEYLTFFLFKKVLHL